MSMLIFIFFNTLVFLSAFILSRRLIRADSLLDFLISFLLFYLAQIVVTLLLLGLFNMLYIYNVIYLNEIILGLIWLSAPRKSSSFNHDSGSLLGGIIDNKPMLFLFCVAFVFGLNKIIINLINPPFGWDSLNYHFTFAVEWLKQGNLEMPPTVFDDPSPPYYPINGSLFYLWLILPLKNVFLADLGQVPFFILACLSVYGISGKLGLKREYAFYAAGLFLLIPNFFKQLEVAYVDVMVAALFLTCVYLLFLMKEYFSWQNTLLFGMAYGLLLGTKTVSLPFAALLFLPLAYLVFKNYNKIYFVFFVISAIIFLGGFSYLRNYFQTGNPLYPLNVTIFAKTIFKGVMDKAVYKAHFVARDYSLAKMLFHEGLGAQALIFVLPAFFLGAPVVWAKKKRMDFFLFYFLSLPILIYLVYYYVIPLGNLRYIYSLLGIGVVCGFMILDTLNTPRRITNTLVIVSVLASVSELAKRQELVFGIIFSIAAFILLPYIYRQSAKIRNRNALFLIIALSLFLSLLFLNNDYDRNEYLRYSKVQKYSGFWPDAIEAWQWLNANTFGQNIAYAGRPVPFPLYGTHFKNNVYYVSVNETEPARLHYFKKSRYNWGHDFLSLHQNLQEKGNYRQNPDYKTWLKNLNSKDTGCFFVYSLHQTKEVIFPLEDAWAKSHPEVFEPIFENGIIHIYNIKK